MNICYKILSWWISVVMINDPRSWHSSSGEWSLGSTDHPPRWRVAQSLAIKLPSSLIIPHTLFNLLHQFTNKNCNNGWCYVRSILCSRWPTHPIFPLLRTLPRNLNIEKYVRGSEPDMHLHKFHQNCKEIFVLCFFLLKLVRIKWELAKINRLLLIFKAYFCKF